MFAQISLLSAVNLALSIVMPQPCLDGNDKCSVKSQVCVDTSRSSVFEFSMFQTPGYNFACFEPCLQKIDCSKCDDTKGMNCFRNEEGCFYGCLSGYECRLFDKKGSAYCAPKVKISGDP